jgi:hypothetical protein
LGSKYFANVIGIALFAKLCFFFSSVGKVDIPKIRCWSTIWEFEYYRISNINITGIGIFTSRDFALFGI